MPLTYDPQVSPSWPEEQKTLGGVLGCNTAVAAQPRFAETGVACQVEYD